MAKTIEKTGSPIYPSESIFEGKRLKVNLGKTKAMESKNGVVVLAKIDPCGVCGKRTRVY